MIGQRHRIVRLALCAALLIAGHGARAEPIGTSGPAVQAAGAQEDAAQAPPDLDSNGLDPLARRLTRKQRSERILDKTFTDAQWQGFEAARIAGLAGCARGKAQACLDAGYAYASGEGAWIVPAIAEILYRQACDAGLGAGCSALASLGDDTFTGWQVDQGHYLRRACKLGDLDGCASLAVFLAGSEDKAEAAEADAIIARTCDAGGAVACAMRADALSGSERPEERRRAAALREFACEHDAIDACLALLAAIDQGAEPDPARVAALTERVCDLGNEDRCSEMSMRAWQGIGMAPDPARAIRYAEAACAMHSRFCGAPGALRTVLSTRAPCEAGDMAACAALGQALAERFSAALDQERAYGLLERACRAGRSEACDGIAAAVGLFPSGERKLGLLRTGCEGGGRAACFSLGKALMMTGMAGGEPDTDAAAALLIPLCDAHYPGACAAEGELVGLAAAARVPVADGRNVPPLEAGAQPAAGEGDICFTAGERFRGKLYTFTNCARFEKGIGSDRALVGAAPWQALIWRPAMRGTYKLTPEERVQCGGSLIATGWILTAAHCLNDDGYPIATSGHRIRLGVYDPTLDDGVSYPILKVVPYPQFGKVLPGQYAYDIALVQYDPAAGEAGTLRRDSPMRRPIAAIALDPIPAERRKIVAGMQAYVYGWGVRAETGGTATDYLQVLKLALASEAACSKTTGFPGELAGSVVCAGRKGLQACYGDSGGPLVYYPPGGAPPVLLGVVSAGRKCGETGRLSQYTRVARFRAWIESNLRAGP